MGTIGWLKRGSGHTEIVCVRGSSYREDGGGGSLQIKENGDWEDFYTANGCPGGASQ